MKTKLLILILALCSITVKASDYVDTNMVVNTVSHNLLLSIPDDYDPENAYPLIIGIHYCGGTAPQFRDALESLTDSLKVIIACPDYSSNRVPEADTNMFRILVDTVASAYNINKEEVYLTAMSCNADFSLQKALKDVYPFKGIFPYAPWPESSSPDVYNFDSDMPTVISIGTNDPKLSTVLNIYDSLKNHQANVQLILIPGINHTLNFSEFAPTMISSLEYLHDTNSITMSMVEDVNMMSNETRDIIFQASHESGQEIGLRVVCSKSTFLPSNEISPTENENEYVFTLDPGDNSSGKGWVVVEAYEESGRAIEQITFKVMVTEYENSLNTDNVSTLNIFPVPAKDVLFISNISGPAKIRIMDLKGRILYNTEFSVDQAEIALDLKAGIYLVEVEMGNTIDIQRFIVE